MINIKQNLLKTKQEYFIPPTNINEIRGESSKTIYRFMTGTLFSKNENIVADNPYDVDDWERNRALLLQYPEWRTRISEMKCLNVEWKNLTENWNEIERLYNKDYEEFGNQCFGKTGGCDEYIRSLINIEND